MANHFYYAGTFRTDAPCFTGGIDYRLASPNLVKCEFCEHMVPRTAAQNRDGTWICTRCWAEMHT